MNLETKLKETQSLIEFKESLKMFLYKYKRTRMSQVDWEKPQPVGLLAYIDGQSNLVELLDPYLET